MSVSQCRRGAAFGVAPAIDIPTPAASVAMAKIVLPWRDLPVVSSENEDVKDVVRFEAMQGFGHPPKASEAVRFSLKPRTFRGEEVCELGV